MSKPKYFLRARYLETYETLIRKYTDLLNSTNNLFDQDIKDLLNFESNLAEILVEYQKSCSNNYLQITINELSNKVPSIDWNLYLKLAIPIAFNDSHSVQVKCLKYFQSVGNLVAYTKNRFVLIISSSENSNIDYLILKNNH